MVIRIREIDRKTKERYLKEGYDIKRERAFKWEIAFRWIHLPYRRKIKFCLDFGIDLKEILIDWNISKKFRIESKIVAKESLQFRTCRLNKQSLIDFHLVGK